MAIHTIIQHVFITTGVFVYPIRVNPCPMQACVRFWLVSHLVTVLRTCCKWRTCVRFWLADKRVQVWARKAAWLLTGNLLTSEIIDMPPSRCQMLQSHFPTKNIKIFHTLYVLTCIRQIFKADIYLDSVLSSNNVLWKNSNHLFSSCKTHRWNRPD